MTMVTNKRLIFVSFQELGGHRGLSNSSGSRAGRRNFQNIDLQNMELDRAPLQVNLLSVSQLITYIITAGLGQQECGR